MTITVPCTTVPATGVGVVLVPPFGVERCGADRLLVTLTERLASAGHTVVLIDPVGTGDSSDIDQNTHAHHTVVEAVDEALLAAFTTIGPTVNRFVAIGLRFGALVLASLPSRTTLDMAGVVLWSPVLSGRSYRRELLMLGSSSSAGLADGWSAPGGNVLSPDDLAAINDLDAKRSGPPAPHILVVDTAPINPELAASWSSSAAVATHIDPALAEAHLEDPELGTIPDAAIAHVVKWVTTTASTATSAGALVSERRIQPRSMAGSGWTEFPVTITLHDGTSLAAISTRPEGTAKATLVLLATGTNPRFGPGRFHTRVARRLAERGFSTLRVERRGATNDPAEVDAYDVRHIDDVLDILRQAPALTGCDRLVLAGTCSGAWAAWHAALHGFQEVKVAEVVLINQIIFGDDSWDLANDSPAIAVKTRQSLTNAGQWKAMLRGEINVARSARRLARYAALTTRNRLRGFDGLAGDLEIIRGSGVPTTFLFDDAETGLVYLRMHGNGHLNELINTGLVRVHTIHGAGHVFTPPASVDWLGEQLGDALARAAETPATDRR
jgi:pimeloyl-ACP methyl ester carboxylesterase